MSYQSGLTTINGNVTTTISGNLPSTSTSQTLCSGYVFNGNSGATITLSPALTSGKSFYCLGMNCKHDSASSGMGPVVNGTQIFKVGGLNTTAGQTLTGGILFKVNYGETFTLQSDINGAEINVWGYIA